MKFLINQFAGGALFLLLAGNAAAQSALDQANIQGDAEVTAELHEQAAQIREQLLAQGPYFALRGEVRAVGGNRYEINGEAFETEQDTRINGSLTDGAYAAVNGRIAGGKKIAAVVNIGRPESGATNAGAPDMAPTDKLNPGALRER